MFIIFNGQFFELIVHASVEVVSQKVTPESVNNSFIKRYRKFYQ